jgi:voltage-dependent potassium channel beta subunit
MTQMQYRNLGGAGMKVSAISLGGWINWGEGKVDEEVAEQIVIKAYESGINFFDLADIYGRGKAERQMGETLKRYPRHTLVISTKVYWPMSDDVNDRGLSRKHIMESITKSLKRLGTEYVDIYFCHRPDPNTPMRETVLTMHNLVEQGLVHYWGTSEWSGAQIMEAYALCERYGWHLPQVEQPQYSLVWREFVERHVMPVTHPRGIGLVVWSPLGQGLLTGKYDEGVPEGTRFEREKWAADRYLTERNIERVRAMKSIADELGVTRAQLALAWVLANPNVSSAIIGATKVSQLEENLKALEVTLSAEHKRQLDELFAY